MATVFDVLWQGLGVLGAALIFQVSHVLQVCEARGRFPS